MVRTCSTSHHAPDRRSGSDQKQTLGQLFSVFCFLLQFLRTSGGIGYGPKDGVTLAQAHQARSASSKVLCLLQAGFEIQFPQP